MFKTLLFNLLGWLSFSMLDASAPTLVVGTNAEFPPFTYIDNEAIVGFDIDIAKEVAKRLDKEIQFKDMPFDALIPEIILGRVDFVAAGMSYTQERAERVSFTKPYLSEDPLVIFSTVKQNVDADSLKDKTVVVIEGFTADQWISSRDDVHPMRLATQADGFMSIMSGRADAFVTAKSTVNAFLEVQDPSQFHAIIIDGTGETCALVVPKGKHEMLADVQKALDSMEQDGTISHLKTKWKLQ